jgi:FtsP/CotA-like multicopper oxidase with cupredoxin domain
LPVIMQARAAADGFTELKISKKPHKLMPLSGKETDCGPTTGRQPGPEIRVKRHDQVRVRLINGLDEPTMLHWHGIRIDNAMDGSPLTQNPVATGRNL